MAIKYREHDMYPESILIRDFEGKVSVTDIIESWDYISVNNLIKDTTKGILNNVSGCDLYMDMNSFKTLIDYLKRQDSLKGIKLAVLSDNPKTIVFPALAESKEQDLKIKPFSTMNAAVNWLMTD